MAHGLQSVLKRTSTSSSAAATNKVGDNNNNNNKTNGNKTGIGSRRIFPPHFKLQVLDSYRNDSDCKGNQRATARKYGIHRRQIQKWLQAETNLRNSVNNNNNNNGGSSDKGGIIISGTATNTAAINCVGGCDLSLSDCCRLRDDSVPDAYYHAQANVTEQPRVPCIGPEAYEPCCASPQTTVHAAAALDYSSSSSNSSLCDMPLSSSSRAILLSPSSPPTSMTYTHSPSLSPSQYNKSPSPVIINEQSYLQHVSPFIQEPIDLSLKQNRAISPSAIALPLAPLYINNSNGGSDDSRLSDPEVWDLSIRKRPIKQEQKVGIEPPAKRPVKLFKPYLDDNQDSDDAEQDQLKPLFAATSPVNNNYNLLTTSANYTYCPSTGYYQQCPMPYNAYSCQHPYGSCPTVMVPLKQRQSYTVDFKLRAIETYYYGEECCRGNQRAVASKYNVHRRQVQKWLRQEDELRTRNINVDPTGSLQMMGHLPMVR